MAVLVAFGAIASAVPNVAQGQSLTPADIAAKLNRPADYRIKYGPADTQFGDLRLPDGSGPHPVAIPGTRRVLALGVRGSDFMSPFADALRSAGIATWNIAYRRIDEDGGGWPGTFMTWARRRTT